MKFVITAGGTTSTLDLPTGVDQSTVTIPAGNYLNFGDPGFVAGAPWKPVSPGYNTTPQAAPIKSDSVDLTPATANPVLFNKQPAPLSSGGIQIPNSNCIVKNPA